MEKIKHDINTFLVDAFNSLMQIEENYLQKGAFRNISVKEMHLIDAVVKLKENNIAKQIAKELNITQSSLTTAVNTLEKKGMLVRKPDEKDRRIVKICATEKAREAYELHKKFHQELVDTVVNELTERELNAFVDGLNKVRYFFADKKNGK
ncbi:MAG: MarR family transcriptional regulator [Oscillospiraceae bacterium]|nr:MarR family transcriptional regulator [Oscillospiraceae bacterium]